jgi:hydrogenase maturation protein HypF
MGWGWARKALWGGEVLAGTIARRAVDGLAAVPLIGGAAAMREPWRNLLAQLRYAFGEDWRGRARPVLAHLPGDDRLRLAESMMASGTNCPPCSSAGRLFDAVAAALGLHGARQSFEGQAAMALEALARPFAGVEGPWLGAGPLRARMGADLWSMLLSDLAAGVAPGRIAARFHHTLADAWPTVPLWPGGRGRRWRFRAGRCRTGCCWRRCARHCGKGLVPLAHRQVPANDGGLALGQGVIAALRAGRGKAQGGLGRTAPSLWFQV